MNIGRAFDILRLRLRSLLGKSRVEQELDRELRFHLEQEARENMAQGMAGDEAARAAARRLGGVTQIQEECRDMRRTNQLETIWNDLRYAMRVLGRAPGFTVVIVLTLALAIGANSAIFSVIEGVLLRPLPYAHPERLVRIFFNSDTFPKFPLNPFDFRDFRARNRTFDSLAAITRYDMQLSGAGEPVMLHSFLVTAGYFRVLGFTPARGREFTTDDELPGHFRLAILSDRLWRTRFASASNIIGRTITINAEPFTVAGVMPPDVRHPGNDYHAVADGDTVDLWAPFTFEGNPNNRGSHFVEGIGRLKPGVSPEQGNADLTAVLAQVQREHPGGNGWRVLLVPLYREMVGRTQHMLIGSIRRGGAAAADRVRKRGESAAGPLQRPAAGNCGARGGWRQPFADRAPIADGEYGDRAGRRGARDFAGCRRRPRFVVAASARISTRLFHPSGPHGFRVHARHRVTDRTSIWNCPGPDCVAQRSATGPYGPGRERNRPSTSVTKSPGGG
jgi:hypothetical protein